MELSLFLQYHSIPISKVSVRDMTGPFSYPVCDIQMDCFASLPTQDLVSHLWIPGRTQGYKLSREKQTQMN